MATHLASSFLEPDDGRPPRRVSHHRAAAYGLLLERNGKFFRSSLPQRRDSPPSHRATRRRRSISRAIAGCFGPMENIQLSRSSNFGAYAIYCW